MTMTKSAEEFLDEHFKNLEVEYTSAGNMYVQQNFRDALKAFNLLQNKWLLVITEFEKIYTNIEDKKIFKRSTMDWLNFYTKTYINQINIHILERSVNKKLNTVISCILFNDTNIKRDDESLNKFFNQLEQYQEVNVTYYEKRKLLAHEWAIKNSIIFKTDPTHKIKEATIEFDDIARLLTRAQITEKYIKLLDSSPKDPQEFINQLEELLTKLSDSAQKELQGNNDVALIHITSEIMQLCLQAKNKYKNCFKLQDEQILFENSTIKNHSNQAKKLQDNILKIFCEHALKFPKIINEKYVLGTLTSTKSQLLSAIDDALKKKKDSEFKNYRIDIQEVIASAYHTVSEQIKEHIDDDYKECDIDSVKKKVNLGLALIYEAADETIPGILLCIYKTLIDGKNAVIQYNKDTNTKSLDYLKSDLLKQYRTRYLKDAQENTTKNKLPQLFDGLKNKDNKLEQNLMTNFKALLEKCEELVINGESNKNYANAGRVALELHCALNSAHYGFVGKESGNISKEEYVKQSLSALEQGIPELSQDRATIGVILNYINSIISFCTYGYIEGIFGNDGFFGIRKTDSLLKIVRLRECLEVFLNENSVSQNL
jgi:hypothetical protein